MRFETYEDQSGEWWWRAIARNGKVVAVSAEGYASDRNATRALAAFRSALGEAPTMPASTQAAPWAPRCECKSPTLSKHASTICTTCGRSRG